MKEQVKTLNATMRLPHAGTNRKVPYSKLYVEPRIVLPQHASHLNAPARPDLKFVLQNSHRTIILGDPGGGKSTLSLKLAWDIARGAQTGTSARVPFICVLRDHAEDFERQKATMIRHLEKICRSPYNVEPPEGAVEYLLSSGRAFVLFDGLDELTDTALRRKVVEFVESFAFRFPDTPILVTSRRVGYDEAPLDPGIFTPVSLANLESSQVKAYAEKWFNLDDTVDKNRRGELADSFLSQSEFVSDLRENPLLLSLMCGIYSSENYIPGNRPDVYKKCAELLFERWDKQRGIHVTLPFDAHVKYALNALALWIYSDIRKQHGLPREEIVHFMTRFLLAKRFDDEAEAENAASQFVDFCTGRAWVLTDVGSTETQSLYGFTHRTFLEYFAATQIVRKNPTPGQLFEVLKERIIAAEWDVVAQLALQMIGNNVEDGSDTFIGMVLESARTADSPAMRSNLISFCGRSLSFAVPRPDIIRAICDIAVQVGAEIGGEQQRFRAIESILHASAENIPNVTKHLRESLIRELERNPSSDVPLQQVIFLSSLPLARTDRSYLSEASLENWRTLESEIFEIAKERLEGFSDDHLWASLMRATLGEISIVDTVNRFGIAALYERISALSAFFPPFVLHGIWRNSDMLPVIRPELMGSIVKCFEDLGGLIPSLETPWFSANAEDRSLLRFLLFGSGGTISQYPEGMRDAVLMLLCPAVEALDISTREPIGKTNGVASSLMIKWGQARKDDKLLSGALASLRSISLKDKTRTFLERWVRRDFNVLQSRR
ncbi:NACHT domain-containing protein [Streptomyces sp. NPDC001351]|uniref:NACHT domain-containing protein n=1 Tax=Streptomyces sp. NPDC001351 TaxID=3364564 RepID=UPI0036960ED6